MSKDLSQYRDKYLKDELNENDLPWVSKLKEEEMPMV